MLLDDEAALVGERIEDAWPALQARRRRWAELLRAVFAVDVEVCARCGGAMRIAPIFRPDSAS